MTTAEAQIPPSAAAVGWCPFATKNPTTKFWPGNKGRRAVVLHIAEGSFDGTVSWLVSGTIQSSAHFVVAKDGRIAQLVSVNDSAWGNGIGWSNGQWVNPQGHAVNPTWSGLVPNLNPNWYTISIEHEGTTADEWTPAMYEANNHLLQWIASLFPMTYVPHDTLIGHCEIDPVDRPSCPGPHCDFDRIAADANRGQPTLATTPLTVDSPICGPASGPVTSAIAFVRTHLRPGSEYANDVATIMGYYWTYAPAVGVDPFLAAAQCVFETDSLNSAWAARPHRNPAGLGVHQEGGLSFDTWDNAVQAHIGQLLAFALHDDEASDAQRQMMRRNPRFERIGPDLRGAAKTIAGLSNRWASDPNYAVDLVARANAMLQT